MALAMMYAEKNPLETEESYPYTAHGGGLFGCKYEKSKGVVGDKGYKMVTPKDEA